MVEYSVTTAGAAFEFDTVNGTHNSCFKIDDTHFINCWSGTNGYSQVFTVNTSTWAVTTANNPTYFYYGTSDYHDCFSIDSNHYIVFYCAGSINCARVLEVNTSNWAITAKAVGGKDLGSGLGHNSCYQIDSNHFINFWAGSGYDGFVQTFTVNTSTWAVTTAGASLEFDTVKGTYNSCCQIDSNHFINFWGGSGNDGYAQTFTVNTSTWAVTTAGASLEFDTVNGTYNSCCQIDSNHFINFFSGDGADGFVQTFTVNTTTWEVTTAAASLEFDTTNGTYSSCYQIDSNHFINFWAGLDNDGYVQVFEVELPAGGGTNITIDGVDVTSITIDGTAVTSVTIDGVTVYS